MFGHTGHTLPIRWLKKERPLEKIGFVSSESLQNSHPAPDPSYSI